MHTNQHACIFTDRVLSVNKPHVILRSLEQLVGGAISIYGECFSKKIGYSKRHIALNPPQNIPLASDRLVSPSHCFLKQF